MVSTFKYSGSVDFPPNNQTGMMIPTPICSMVLVYLPTKLGDFVWAHVGKYMIIYVNIPYMEHIGHK